jgi:hypothetical protein
MSVIIDEVLVPEEHAVWKGFYYSPDIRYFVISRHGVVISCTTGKIINMQVSRQGYLYWISWDPVKKKTRAHRLHRILALTFIGRPVRHLNIPFRYLDVNHKDGETGNYSLDNLEWVTKKENTQHAITNELWKFKPTLARNIQSGEIKRYVTATHCAKEHDITVLRFHRHLKSPNAGTITKNWWVFKYDDGGAWPAIAEDNMVEDRWSSDFGIWYAKSTSEADPEQVVLANTLREMLEVLGIKMGPEQAAKILRESPRDKPFHGWLIWYDERPPKEVAASMPQRYKPQLQAAFRIQATNLKTGEVSIHESMARASTALGVSVDHIRNVFRRGSVRDDYLFEKLGVNTELIDRTGKGCKKE